MGEATVPWAAGRAWAIACALTALAMLAAALLPAGSADGPHNAASAAGRILGQLALLLLAASLASSFTHRARLATWLHVGVGLAVLLLSVAHLLLLLRVGIAHGWVSGALALLVLAAHGSLGANKRRALRTFGAARWRFAHRASGSAALALALEHTLLYGRHWGLLSGLVG